MSKLSFRARALDPSKPMPIYLANELPDLPEYSAINRAVPQMPSGMEKEEESEHHLQRAICAGLLIPTPEVTNVEDEDFYNRVYPADYKMPKQLIHMQPLGIDQDIPDYDMDSADEIWLESQQSRLLDLTPLKFEQMMDKLEKSSGQTVVNLNEAKALLKEDDDVSTTVYDYWLNKRLTTQIPLIPSVKTENRTGMAPNNPYLAFRRRTEKMQTRKNRKNDEFSYEKMCKLKRELSRAGTLLELIKRREKAKRAQLLLTIEIFEKRYAARDFNGQLMQDVINSMKSSQRPACAPLHSNQFHSPLSSSSNLPTWGNNNVVQGTPNSHYLFNSGSQYHHSKSHSTTIRDADGNIRKEKRQYRKRKHKLQKEKGMQSNTGVGNSMNMSSSGHHTSSTGMGYSTTGSHHLHHLSSHHVSMDNVLMSSDAEDEFNNEKNNVAGSESEDEGVYAFKRNRNCNYHKPITNNCGSWPWEENGKTDKKYRFTLTSIKHPRPRCIGFARRRMARGGRIALDRYSTNLDEFWQSLDYTIFDSEKTTAKELSICQENSVTEDRLNPVTLIESNLDRIRARVCSIRTSSASESGGFSNISPSPLSCVTGNSRPIVDNVIKRESLDGIITNSSFKIKEEQMDDYERLIDNVNNDRNNKQISNSSNASSNNSNNIQRVSLTMTTTATGPDKLMTETPNNNNNNNSKNSSFTNEFLDYAVKSERTGSITSSKQTDVSTSIAHLLHGNNATIRETQESRDSGISIKSESIQNTLSHMNDNDASSLFSMHQLLPQELSDSIYDEFLDEIEKSWLHFRPKTPPLNRLSPSSPPIHETINDMISYDSDALEALNRLTNGPFNVELQTLEGSSQLPQNIFATENDIDEMSGSLFVTTEPINLNALMSESMMNRLDKETSKSLDNANISSGSHESLNELGLNESINEDNEKLLANILEECQMEDGNEALNQTSNFWNGLLEEDGNAPVSIDLDALEVQGRASTPKFDKSIGYCSDALSLYSKIPPITSSSMSSKKQNGLLKCQSEIGRSNFKLTRTKMDQLLHLKLKNCSSTNLIKSDSTTIIPTSMAIDDLSNIQVKIESRESSNLLQKQKESVLSTTPIVSSTTDSQTNSLSLLPSIVQQKTTDQPLLTVIKQEHIVTPCDATASHDYAAPPIPVVHSIQQASPTIIPSSTIKSATFIRTNTTGQIWQQQQPVVGNNTQQLTIAGVRRPLNNPQVLQNLLRTSGNTTYVNSQQQKPQSTIVDDNTGIRDTKLKHNNIDSSSTNHQNTMVNSLSDQQQQPQQVNIIHSNLAPQFAIIGSTTGTGSGVQNRIFLTSTPQQVTQTSGAINTTTLATIPSTAIIMSDSGKAHTTDGKTAQRVKLGDNRILYATNLKGNRGQLVTAQLNQKIIQFHHSKNNTIIQTSGGNVHPQISNTTAPQQATGITSGQTINVVATPFNTKTGHMIQRVATINNSQNIRNANNTQQGINSSSNLAQQQQQQQQQQKVIGLVSTAATAVIDSANTTTNTIKIIQTNDNNSVSGININTSNR